MFDAISRVVTYPAPIQRVWTVLTTPDYLVTWMSSTVKPFRLATGEEIWFAWGKEEFRALIVTVEAPRLFVWTWYPGSGEQMDIPLEDQGPLTTVTFALETVPEGTRLTLTETGFAALTEARNQRALAENNHGWDECLAQIGEIFEVPIPA